MGSPSGKLRILLVDDEVLVRRALERHLRHHEVLHAEGYAQALDVLRSHPVDVIVSDSLASLGGVNVLRAASELQPTARRIMWSTDAPPRLTQLVKDGVIHCFVPKPWDASLLLGEIQKEETAAVV